MKSGWLGILGGVLLFTAQICLADTSTLQLSLQDLTRCVQDLQTVQNRFLTKVPATFLTLDANLLRIAQGVRYVEANATTLASNVESDAPRENLGMLASNAAEGCHSYLSLFDSRLKFYLIFVGCLFLTALILTVSLVFNMVPLNLSGGHRRARKKQSASDDKTPAPSDVPRDRA